MSLEAEHLSELALAALSYADRGWFVHPLWPSGHINKDGNPADKTPATRNGFKDATSDKTRVRTRWVSHPTDNIGIACGKSGLVVVDIDRKSGVDGAESLQRALNYALPPTLTARTANGGEHWYYLADQWIEVKSSTNLLPGVDIRAIDGYVVAPPSQAEGRPYLWHNPGAPIASVPWEILALTSKQGLLGRNDFLAKILGPRLRNASLDGEELLDHMMQRNLALFSRHRDGPLDASEVRKIASSVMRNMDVSTPKLTSTDEANGIRLHRRAATELRWVWERKIWYYWGGHRWVPDNSGAYSGRMSRLSADELLDQIKEDMPAEIQNKLFSHYKYSKSVRGWQNALHALLTIDGMAVSATIFDVDPWLLGVKNGVIELRTGTYREGVREDYLTRSVMCDYDPAALCPRFEKCMREICVGQDGQPDPALVDWWQRFFGYCLTGLTTEQCFVFAWGDGANGKSTLIETIATLLIDYAQTIPVSVLVEGSRQYAQGNTPEYAKLVGARLVQSNETRAGQAFSTSDIKQLTGSDKITAQAKFEHPITFQAQFKLIIRGNDRPTFSAIDEGFKRRLFAVPFFAHFKPGATSYEPHLQLQLLEELPGILNWCIRGCRMWQERPLHQDIPPSMQALRAEWIDEQVTFGDFIRDCCELGPADEYYVEPSPLYNAYKVWSRGQQGMRLSTKAFRHAMERYGNGVHVGQRKWTGGKAVRAYTGIRLSHTYQQTEDY